MEAVALRYAESLFSLGEELNNVDQYAKDMALVDEVLSSDPSFVQFFSHVLIEDSAKIELLDKSFKGQVDDYVLNFLKLLVQKRRIRYISNIVVAFQRLYNDYRGIEEGIVFTSFDLDSKEVESLEKAIGEKENKTVHLKVKKDPSLVGGVKIQIDNRVYDGSIQNKVEMLKKELLRK